ncbi:hypothetical protein C8R44DRAFT_975416 [Mycena epipterygia]|nr:hypothetical protein C8R44DRAFT_975416 [Mycena epipterygia]
MAFMPFLSRPRFYTEYGDCVVRVGETLFNINRALFSQHSIVFRDLFRFFEGLPAEWTRGTSIVLYGDTPDEFRDLCWVLQTPSDKLQLHLYRDPGDLARLISLWRLFDKYKCTAYVDRELFRFPWIYPLDRIPHLVLIRLSCPGSPVVGSFTRKFRLVVGDSELVSDLRLLYQSYNVIWITICGTMSEVEDGDAMIF